MQQIRPRFLFACLGVVAGCGSDLDEKRSEWRTRAPEAYVVRTCSYGFAPPACTLSVVQGGEVLAAERRFSPDAAWAPITEPVAPIEALFSSAEGVDDACELSLDFDAVYAYPADLYIDCGEEGRGERVECFVPDSVDLEACRGSTP